MAELKLIALDVDDLKIISAHLQDAVGRISDIVYDKKAKRFALVLNRFDWTTTEASAQANERHQSGLAL